jgi:hypothetical protein
LIFFVIPFLLLVLWMFEIVIAASNQNCVCHVENEETGRGHVIEVDESALQGHLRHGDVQCTVDCSKVKGDVCNVSTGGQCAKAK